MNTYDLNIQHTEDRKIDIDFSIYASYEDWLDERARFYKTESQEAWNSGSKPSQAWRRELVLAERFFGKEGESKALARFLLDAENRKHLPGWLRGLADKVNADYLSFPSLTSLKAARNTIADIIGGK